MLPKRPGGRPGSSSWLSPARRCWPRRRCCATPPRRCGRASGRRPHGRAPVRARAARHPWSRLARHLCRGIRQLAAYAERAARRGLGEIEELLVEIGLGEYLAQIVGGIPMSQGEIVRPADLGLSSPRGRRLAGPLEGLMAGNAERRARLVALMRDPTHIGGPARRDARLDPRRDAQVRRQRDRAACAGLASRQQSIPLDVIAQMAELGVFGLTIPEASRRHGARQGGDVRRRRGAVARLYRRRLARHPLGDRGRADPGRGTEEQKRDWLPKIASGEVLPTAVFTEPDAGSDLASLKTARGAHDGAPRSRQQDLDHPCGARRPDDAAGAHRSERAATAASPCCSPRSRAAPTRSRFRRPACRAARSRCSAIAA